MAAVPRRGRRRPHHRLPVAGRDPLTLSLPDGGGIKATGFNINSRPDAAFGGVLAAGVRFRSGRVAVTPEFRVTHWRDQFFTSRRDDPGLCVGFTF
jgi:hypothetical protein